MSESKFEAGQKAWIWVHPSVPQLIPLRIIKPGESVKYLKVWHVRDWGRDSFLADWTSPVPEEYLFTEDEAVAERLRGAYYEDGLIAGSQRISFWNGVGYW